VCRRTDEFGTKKRGDQPIANNANPKINSEGAYENAHLVAQDLVTRIGELLFDLPAPEFQIVHLISFQLCCAKNY
jgi:hypothetical protein